MKNHMITKFKMFEYHEENINKILDKINKHGKDSLTDFEKEILQNQGDIKIQKYYEKGHFEFDYDSTKNEDKKIIVNGTLKYKGKEYHGCFTYPQEIEHESSIDDKFYSASYGFWKFFDERNLEFEPDDDDFYDLDDLMQEVEANFVN